MKTQNLFESAKAIVIDSGDILLNNFNAAKITTEKGFGNFVTKFDLEIEEYIIDKLKNIMPESVIISEEQPNNQFDFSKPTWIIDPIDGTTNFIHGYPHVAICLSYIDINTAFGIVYNPILKELFTGIKGKGAFLNDNKISVSKTPALKDSIVGFGLPYDREKSKTIFHIAERVYGECSDLKRKGSAALDILYVACGRLDGYFELDLNIWDYSASKIILEEAGGVLTTFENKRVDRLIKSNVLASNSKIHEELINLIKL